MVAFSLTNVHTTCFAASYAVALILELSRFFLRAPARHYGTIGFTAAGLVAQTLYILLRTSRDVQQIPPLSSWYDWLLLVSWGIALAYLLLAIRRPQAAAGVFMLPLVLALIGVASGFRDAVPFERDPIWIWGVIHGASLLMGSIFVMLGFISGLMYLVQSHRLKRKLPPLPNLKLPSLEWLQGANKRSLVTGSILLAIGLISGVMLNLVRPQRGMPWTDPVIWSSAILLAWLVVVLVFEALYKPAQQGRKMAYLTLASFLFLGLVLAVVLIVPSAHAGSSGRAAAGAGASEVSSPVAGGER